MKINIETATEAQLQSLHDSVRTERDKLVLTTEEHENVRNESVRLKGLIRDERLKEQPDESKIAGWESELNKIAERRKDINADYAQKRSKAKATMRRIELERKRRFDNERAGELQNLSGQQLEEERKQIIEQRQYLKERAKAVQIELDRRADEKRWDEIMKDLTPNQRAMAMEKLKAQDN